MGRYPLSDCERHSHENKNHGGMGVQYQGHQDEEKRTGKANRLSEDRILQHQSHKNEKSSWWIPGRLPLTNDEFSQRVSHPVNGINSLISGRFFKKTIEEAWIFGGNATNQKYLSLDKGKTERS